MSMSAVEKAASEAIGRYEACSDGRVKAYQRVIDRLDELEKRGIVQKRGNQLLPIEERHKLSAEYRNTSQ